MAYFNKPAPNTLPLESGSFAMSAPTFDLAHQQVWYADGDSGFYVVKLTCGASVVGCFSAGIVRNIASTSA